jgi:aminoglycoside phosphotransferase (APT) family kinase protein
VQIDPGGGADFVLFSDDGTTYSYEKGGGSVTQLHWDEAPHRLSQKGAAWERSPVVVIGVTHPRPTNRRAGIRHGDLELGNIMITKAGISLMNLGLVAQVG